MAGDLDHSDFVDPDFQSGRRPAAAPSVSAIGGHASGAGQRPPSRDEINQKVTAAQQALAELKRRQDELERERTGLEEARRRRTEYDQGREEMLVHLTRGVGLLTEAEQSARAEVEAMGRSLADLKDALEKVSALNEASWGVDQYSNELTRALTTLENARMEWNSAQRRWEVLRGAPAVSPDSARGGSEGTGRFPDGRTPGEWARMGLALTWPVAVAVLAVGIVLALVLARR